MRVQGESAERVGNPAKVHRLLLDFDLPSLRFFVSLFQPLGSSARAWMALALSRGLVRCSTSLRTTTASTLVHACRRALQTTSAPAAPLTNSPSVLPSAQPEAIKRLTQQLAVKQPRFPVRGDEVKILEEPKEFYQALLVRPPSPTSSSSLVHDSGRADASLSSPLAATLQNLIKNARRRIVISTLYIGVEQNELVRRAPRAAPSVLKP